MAEIINPDFRELQKAMRKSVDSERKSSCGPVPQIKQVRVQIVDMWKRKLKSIAAEMRMDSAAVVTVIREDYFDNLIQFPGPRGPSPNPPAPAAGTVQERKIA